ncbi:SDR family NAD(P)-dependent oxidoreductase [Sinorhizobium meliloti]|uniref:SDR family NAD(P)-dependent oxidoreductase n=1 Tax=Rhizobium meliloti TaxID=382 RepID=UPI003F173387
MAGLKSQIVVITGGETGIGRSTVELLAQKGAMVIIGGVLDEEGAATVKAVTSAGGAAEFVRTDVRYRDQIEALIDGVIKRHGKIDALINNAAVFDGFVNVLETTDGLWEQIMNVNLRGPFWTSRAVIPHMLKAGKGKIINTSSIGGIAGYADGPAYTASKHGLIGLTKQIACEYASQGIAVNAVCPGSIETDVRGNSAKLLGENAPAKMGGAGSDTSWLSRVVPANRKGKPEEIAELIAFLVSDAASYINGQSFVIDGGWTAK